MVAIRPFEPKDITQVVELLGALNPSLTNEQWSLLFKYSWESGSIIKGMVIEDNSIINGFICFVGSENKTLKTINLSSWIVNEKYRNQSLKMLLPAFKENAFILNLTPKENTLPIYKILGFKTLAKFDYYINPIKFRLKVKSSHKTSSNLKCSIIENDLFFDAINTADYKEYPWIKFVTIDNPTTNEKILLSVKLNKAVENNLTGSLYKFLGYINNIELMHCSDSIFFNAHLKEIILLLIKIFKPRIIQLSEHFIFSATDMSAFNKQLKSTPWIYYYEQEVDTYQISLLNSEKTLLNI